MKFGWSLLIFALTILTLSFTSDSASTTNVILMGIMMEMLLIISFLQDAAVFLKSEEFRQILGAILRKK